MIASRTPFRVSLFGGGTDYPAWYNENGGAAIGFSINKYCYIFLRNLPGYFDHQYRIVYSKTEITKSVRDIKHPAVRNILQTSGIGHGLELLHDGEVPARSGLGTSSAFTVGLLNAVHALKGQRVDKATLANEAIHMEQVVIGESVGSQDQLWAAHGGMNRIDFHGPGAWSVRPLSLPTGRAKALIDHLLLVYTGGPRIAASIATHQIVNVSRNGPALRAMHAMVDEADAILRSESAHLSDIGRMLHEAWRLKRGLAKEVSTPTLEETYETALEAGALGGKVLGAGGGGFMLFFVPPEKRRAVLARLTRHLIVDIDVDWEGSRAFDLATEERIEWNGANPFTSCGYGTSTP
jgi:D-glycero-alpha-D-manno-heptose-7-phosphate kinase